MSNNQFFKIAGAIALFLFSIVSPGFAQIKTRPPVQVSPVTEPPVELNECLNLKATIQRHSISEAPCCYKITLNNGLAANSKLAPWGFQVELKYGQIIQVYGTPGTWKQTPLTVPPRTGKVQWQNNKLIPAGSSNLASICIETDKPTWLYYAWLDRTGKILCRDSTLINDCLYEYETACKNQLVRNGEFAPGAANQPPANWAVGYGAPKFLNTAGEGCFDPGYAELSGNLATGDAIVQTLAPNNKIVKGKKYILQVAVKFQTAAGGPNYCRLRAVAYTTMSFAGIHPKPSSDVAIIGRSGRIRACNAWSIVEFPVWVANKDFPYISLTAFTDDNTVSKIWIDNVSLCETGVVDPCEELTLDAQEKPLTPAGFGNLPPGITCPPVEAETDNYENGSLQDLYGQLYGYNGTTSWYAQAGDKCFSLGGTIPAEVDKFNCDDSLKVLGINISCDDLQKGLANPDLSAIPIIRPPRLPVIPAPTNGTCKGNPPPEFIEMPFKGRDIIFIHGLQLDHLCDRANGVKGAQADWPNQQQEFYTGYYKAVAMGNFGKHIQRYLHTPGYKNRYIVVTYNCSQSAEIAAHAVLSQIREAMENGKGVIFDPSDPRQAKCFGREYIFISHSTGALVADIALSIANMTKTNTSMKAKWGDIGLLSDRCKGRVSFRGAFAGSHLATLFVAFQKDPELSMLASGILTKGICEKDFSTAVDRNMVFNSVLVDLVPSVTKARWSNYLQAVPVPVVEISSGHPSDITPPFLKGIHPGFDDGVLTVDCSTGSSSPAPINQPSRYRATKSVRVFDMGQRTLRAIYYYRDQAISAAQREFASGNTPYLSPTGMVQPVDHVLVPSNRYSNHYSFIQSASEHWLEDDYSSGQYEPTKWEKSSNWEEELVVEDVSLFSTGIINPGIISEMSETIKEKVIYYPAFRIKIVKGIPRPIIVWKKFYIWKRTYHTLRDQGWYDYDYAYKYLFRN